MLMKCPECGLQVSSIAMSCPHCGYPINSSKKVKTSRKMKRMKLPNGFGQISEITGQPLRKPFRVMVNEGFNEYGKPISKLLKPVAYFETYNDAYMALVEYHKNPYDKNKDITILELFDKWMVNYYDPVTNKSSMKTNKSLFKYVYKIYDKKASELKSFTLKDFLENLDISADAKIRLKTIFNQMYDYAISLEIVDKNISRNFELSNSIKTKQKADKVSHIIFTDDELKTLWSNIDKYPSIKDILIHCYTGWRPGELCSIKREHIDIQNMFMVGGNKTENGKNRRVPIHPCIQELVLEKYNSNSVMFNSYKIYRGHFIEIISILNLNPNHSPHDCRTTFITNCKKYNVDEYAIKRMVGHAVNDITENVYTKRSDEWLKHEIEKIKVYK